MNTYGLVGYPLGHSFSKQYFEQKFISDNITAQFINFEIANLDKLIVSLKNTNNLKGFSVTIPHKENILKYLDRIDAVAKEIGAVNAVKVLYDNKKLLLEGYNTDYLGFGKSLDEFLGNNKPSHALILGTGGASKAIAFALKERAISFTKVSRTPKGKELYYTDIDLSRYKLIINTTPLGTFPSTNFSPNIPYEQLTPYHYLFDLVYNPNETEFLKKGRLQQSHTINGLSMLHYQAEYAWKLWNC